MGSNMVDVTLHIDENTSQDERERLRNALLGKDGVLSAVYHDDKPHLMIIAYTPEVVSTDTLLQTAQRLGLHAELVGL